MNVASRRRLVLLYVVAAALLISLGGRLYYIQVMNSTSFTKLAAQNQNRVLLERGTYCRIDGIVGSDICQCHAAQFDAESRTQRDDLHRQPLQLVS